MSIKSLSQKDPGTRVPTRPGTRALARPLTAAQPGRALQRHQRCFCSEFGQTRAFPNATSPSPEPRAGPGRVMCFPGGAGAEAAAAAPEAGAGLPGSGSCCVCLSARGREQPGREHPAVIFSSRFSLRTTDVPQAQRLLRRPACWHEGPARLPQSSLQKGALAPSGLGRLQLSSPNLTPGGLTPEGCRARPRLEFSC